MPKKKPEPAKPRRPRRPRAPGLIGERLAKALAYRNLTALDLAMRLQIWPSVLSTLIHNTRSKRGVTDESLKRIVLALNDGGHVERITSDYLLGIDDRMTRPRE